MSASLVFGPIAIAVFITGMWIGYPLHQRRVQARADAMVDHLLSGLASDPGEIRKHRRPPPRGWNEVDGRPGLTAGGEGPGGIVALHTPKHASDAIAGWDTFTYPGRHAYGRVHLIVGIEARAAYDAAVLTVQAIIRSVHSKRELVTS